MFADVDLRALAEMTAPERAFLSVYLSGPQSVPDLDKKLQKARKLLDKDDTAKDEREYFDRNAAAVNEYLERNPLTSGALCIFSCWVLDFFQPIPLQAPVRDIVRVDSSPYIRPLAELQDEYENVAVLVADNKKARIFMISSALAGPGETVEGNIKNHVKKGGWSQQRYERRRDKELLLYAREIVDALARLEQEEHFRRIVLVGGKEILRIVQENLPKAMQDMVIRKDLDLGKGEASINREIMDLFFERERRSELDLWERIRTEYLQGGLGAIGLNEVLRAVEEGRIQEMIVTRTFHPEGRRCRECERVHAGPAMTCTACGSTSLYAVDLVNEIVEMLKLTGATVDFADPIPSLTEAGDIAALLRFRS